MKHNKKILLVFLVSILFVTLIGCSSNPKSNSAEKNIEKTVENIFKPITENEFNEYQKSTSEKKLPKWVENRFKSQMTESSYKQLLNNSMFTLPIEAFETNNKTLKLSDLKITKGESGYDISGKLSINDETPFPIEGVAQVNKDGLVSHIEIVNIPSILEKIKK